MELYPKRKNNRLKDFDYDENGYYFVTICTKDKKDFFGTPAENRIDLNLMGKQAAAIWLESGKHNTDFDFETFVIMPNHFHGILYRKNTPPRDAYMRPLQIPNTGVSKAVQQYKAAVTRFASANGINFAWQRSFYDRIIRSDVEYYNIEQYIIRNPLEWKEDMEYHTIDPEELKKYYEKILTSA